MEKGFDRVVNEAKSSPKPDRSQPLSMQHLQACLSTYFDGIPDPRVDRFRGRQAPPNRYRQSFAGERPASKISAY